MQIDSVGLEVGPVCISNSFSVGIAAVGPDQALRTGAVGQLGCELLAGMDTMWNLTCFHMLGAK